MLEGVCSKHRISHCFCLTRKSFHLNCAINKTDPKTDQEAAMQPSFHLNRLSRILLFTGIFIASLYLRWGYIKNTSIIKPVMKDAYAYALIAHNLADNHVFSSAKDPKGKSSPEARPPGYSFFLAAIVLITDSFNSFYHTALWIQSIIGALTVLLAYALARFILPKPWSLMVAFLVMVSPHMIVTCAYLLSECLFTFLLLLSTVLLMIAVKSNKLTCYALSGITLGLSIFTRPVLGVFPLLCALIIYFFKGKENRRRVFASLVLFLVTSYFFQFSWSLWQKASFGSDIVMSNQLKTAFICGTYPDITFDKLAGMPYREDLNYETLSNGSYGSIAFYILNQFKNEPMTYLTWWFFKKPVMFWSWKIFFSDGINFYPVNYSWFDINPFMKSLRQIMLMLHPMIVLLAGFSIFLYGKRFLNSDKVIEKFCYITCFVLLAHFTLMFTILAPFPRYALPMGPELYLMSIFAVYQIVRILKPDNSRPQE